MLACLYLVRYALLRPSPVVSETVVSAVKVARKCEVAARYVTFQMSPRIITTHEVSNHEMHMAEL